MTKRQAFNFHDIAQDCRVVTGQYRLDDNNGKRNLGIKIHIPVELQTTYPYNASAYAFLQELRHEIFEAGLIEFPHLSVNPVNYTLAQKAPWQHQYSSNSYLTDFCQSPHQDTPPYPTAFWLNTERFFFATWVLSESATEAFYHYQRSHPDKSIEEIHQILVPQSLKNQQGIILNQTPGLLLIDNSHHHYLYHARTCQFEKTRQRSFSDTDSPMYAFNEIGLLQYMDTLDSQRGQEYRDENDLLEVEIFLAQEKKFQEKTITFNLTND